MIRAVTERSIGRALRVEEVTRDLSTKGQEGVRQTRQGEDGPTEWSYMGQEWESSQARVGSTNIGELK